MRSSGSMKYGIGLFCVAGSVMWIAGSVPSCGVAPTPFIVHGPGDEGNEQPSLTILEPNTSITRGQGDPFLVRWTDRDRDDNAQISFSLVSVNTNDTILLVAGIDENDLTGPDAFTVGTTLIPPGTYNVLGVIDDGVNGPVEAYATLVGAAVSQRSVVTIVGPGEGPQTQPPVITVTEPSFNLSVAQDDILHVEVQPSIFDPDPANPIYFDPDSELRLFILLDLDLDPNNDDPANPDPRQIIILHQQSVAPLAFDVITLDIPIDLAEVPARPVGEPYYIRATVDDGTNPRVHQYAVGTINVVQLAAGTVDLFEIGRSKSGVRFYGFNPGAALGSSISHVGDFDADGVDDFVMVAQFGNPRNLGPVGEAYLVYGQGRISDAGIQIAGNRFGGAIPVNSISEIIDGVIFEAPPVRTAPAGAGFARLLPGIPHTEGIADVSFVPDLSGDGRPELLFGLPHVYGAFEAMDFDPGDDDITGEDQTIEKEVVLRQGLVTVETGDDDPVVTSVIYAGVEEVTIRSDQPNSNFGSTAELTWMDAGPDQRAWGLVKFRGVLDQIPDSSMNIDISSVQATLEFRLFNTGGPGTLHQALTDFTEQTRFSSFARNGGEPEDGVDYVGQGDELGTIDGQNVGAVTVDISDLVVQLLDGQLSQTANELRFIIVPDPTEGGNETGLRSSEFNIDTDRPTLRISYTRLNFFATLGCYPDPLVNNMTDSGTVDPRDIQWYAGGMATVVNSENRDNEPRDALALRLGTTSVALELVGQESGPRGAWRLDADGINQAGVIATRADNTAEELRIAGARFEAGAFDHVDHLFLNQPPRAGLFGQTVGSIGDLNNDGLPELIFSAPTNERYLQDLLTTFGFQSTHWWSTMFRGSIAVVPGNDYNASRWRESPSGEDGTTSIPVLDQQAHPPGFGKCTSPIDDRHMDIPPDSFMVFAEDVDDMLGGAGSAGDFNQDGLDDILCGAYMNDSGTTDDTGALYILYGRNVLGDFDLTNADDSQLRAPMLRVRGVKPGDQIGWKQTSGLDVNGDRINDVFFASPRADFGGVTRATCARNFDNDPIVSSNDLRLSSFNGCLTSERETVFVGDACDAFDYDNDGDVDSDDRCVFCCLSDDCQPDADCVSGKDGGDCCKNLVDNGFVGIIFGGVFIDGDRDINQLADPIRQQLPGTIFFGSGPGHLAGMDISSAGDFNQDGFGDILITAPGEERLDSAGRTRVGVVYLVFGGGHLTNRRWNLADVGTEDLPGIVFISPYVAGRPNEAAPTTVAFIGDINDDGFGDIAIGNPGADFIDSSFPQGPNAPGNDAAVGRRSNVGDVYVIYGNNFGSNRASP